MKSHQQLLIVLSLSLAPVFSGAQTHKCVEREDQIRDVATIQAFVEKIGGLQELEGDWKLGGFAGAFKKVVVAFQSKASGLTALVDGLSEVSKQGPISVCETSRPDTLYVKVLKTKDGLYMRAGKPGSLQLAQIQNNKVGTFYTFNKQ